MSFAYFNGENVTDLGMSRDFRSLFKFRIVPPRMTAAFSKKFTTVDRQPIPSGSRLIIWEMFIFNFSTPDEQWQFT